ncbi:16S rRNA (adenine(1518)-N(6)/adenine(1519)-N(6))-dimethyltransferase RsmA [Acidiferrobacter sp.]|uniref:16S rRNA (adenine(1518)-N(6)/adenine(1519)-N(6))- dimethyltransferase RsmA n=1 Tax=Acidiferrobacter sp. TaxID=1872107 RepID=UPI00262C0BDD|nr:16S rRNA (adenine(1518)-N(6)/adenine(1519)-N(6))-dimethyltransferase RsmA [Acidiferrobacter sp.]
MPALKKRFGQHFLRDESVLARIAGVCAHMPGDRTIEIGPGDGALTAHLLRQAGELHVIEVDRDLIRGLARRFAGGGVIIHEADALRFPLCTAVPGRLRVVGNLPYNISSPLIFHCLAQPCITGMAFLLQKEVVDRLAAAPGGRDYGRLSVMVQARCEVVPLFTVPPEAFYPPPAVVSRLVTLRKVPSPVPPADTALFAAIVACAFSQRRKMLRHSLRAYFGDAAWRSLGIDPVRRPETLSVAEFAALAAYAHTQSRESP